MKNIICFFTLSLLILITGTTTAQILSTANLPSQATSSLARLSGPSVYGVFVGRTPCQELLTDLNMEENAACTKRKMRFVLYQDPVTHEPTNYETQGMGKWSGKGKWRILQGTPTEPRATVFQLELDANTSLYLLKGDDNVLFILDGKKNFLIGNEKYSYTMNRARN
jgi:hypothetical protein